MITLFFKSPARKAQENIGFSKRLEQFDPYGTIIFVPAIVCLLLALQWGGSKYAWSDGKIIALFVIFGILILVFVGIQYWKGDNATVPFRIVTQRSMASASFFAICLGGSFFLLIYYLPIWFQAITHVSATESGIRALPMVLGVVIFSVLAGAAITKLGYYSPFMIVSAVLTSIGAGLLTTFTVHTSNSKWIGYQIIYGAGIGFGMQQPLIAAQTVLALKDVPVGTAVIMFTQTLGGALFVSVGNNVFTNKLISGLAKAAPTVDPKIVTSVGATSLQKYIPHGLLPGVLVAYNDALTKTFQISLVLSCMSLIGAAIIEWKSVKGKKIETVAA